jgi:hypothetical protein
MKQLAPFSGSLADLFGRFVAKEKYYIEIFTTNLL